VSDWQPRSRNYAPGDGTVPDGPWVFVPGYGDWHWAMIRYQQWSVDPPAPGLGPGEVLDDWAVVARVGRRSVWAPANDVDWEPDDSGLAWLADKLGLTPEQVREPVTW
jgi:hypothetical protein